ncbi:MAG: hypothetical protein AAF732_19020 [Pseudomonadota bacterium]
MFARILSTLLFFVATVFLVTLFVANRHPVQIVVDPFNPQNPALGFEMPFFWYLLGSILIGVFVGAVAVWLGQGKWRRMARQRTQEAIRWKAEVDRLTRERDDHVQAAKKLAATTPTPERALAITGR